MRLTASLLLTIVAFCYSVSPAYCLDQQGKEAGKSSGDMFKSWVGNKSAINSKLNQPLTNKNVNLQSMDAKSSGQAAAFCGTGNVQNEKLALSVTVTQGSITVSSDTNKDGLLDSTNSFAAAKSCIDGYKTVSDTYYRWSVNASGVVSSVASAQLNGCVDWNAQPPTFAGGAIARSYAEATALVITNSSYLNTTATYYAGNVKDCSGKDKTPSETKYLHNPYTMNDDAATKMAACSSNDPTCQAYTGVKSGSSNMSGGTGGTAACSITRNIIDAKGPQNSIICESSQSYYPAGYSEQAKICYKTAGDSWDYTSAFRARCNSYGKELTLEGWASWEGAPCGQNAKFPPLPQVSLPLTYGGSSAPQIIGKLSTNRRMSSQNTAYNDQDADVRCYSDVTLLNVRLSHSCAADSSSCTYTLSVDNAPACDGFAITIAPPVGETFDNSCKSYEEQGCSLLDEWWYDATGKKVQTFKNGDSTNNFTPATCKTFPVVGSVCREWWKKDRVYDCAATGKKYSPDISRAATVMESADNTDSDTIKYAKSPFNKENTQVCIGELDLSITSFTSEADCRSKGGSISCKSPYSYSSAVNKCTAAPSCSSPGTYNSSRHMCEATPSKICPIGYSYDQTTDRCLAAPICSTGAYSPASDSCELPAVPTCVSPMVYNSATQLCETAPVCSTGTFDPATGTCRVAASNVCQSPFSYNSSEGQCQTAPLCSSGTYNPATDSCEEPPTPTCASPYVYDSVAKKCAITPPCSSGSFNTTTNRCESPKINQFQCPSSRNLYAADTACNAACVTTAVCSTATPPVCPLGSYTCTVHVFPSSCSAPLACVSVLECSSGMTWNGSVCTSTPICPGTGSLNTTTHRCERAATKKCSVGMTLQSGTCVATASCPSPSVLNTLTDKCEMLPAACAPGQTYNAGSNSCSFPAGCSGGTLDAARNICTSTPDMCQSGFVFDSDVCRKAPACPSGGSLSPSTDKCEAPVDNCPSGFTYQQGLNICQQSPWCADSGVINMAAHICELDATCVGKSYPELQCKYQDPVNHTGLYCAINDYAVQPYEKSRRIHRDCIESKQCDIACVIQIPDASQQSGFSYEKRLCNQPTPTTYECPSGGYTVQKQCDCIIDTWDPKETRGDECEISCMTKSPAPVVQGNVRTNYKVKTCDKTMINNQPKYTCNLAGDEVMYHDCDCPDAFGLTAGIMGALVEAVNDRECQ